MKDGYIKVRCISPEIKLGNISFNVDKITEIINDSFDKEIKVLALPELSLCGYTCADLFFQDTLIRACENGIDKIRKSTKNKKMLIVVGAPLRTNNKLYDCAVVISNSKILGVVPKTNLYNFGESYESRYFSKLNTEEKNITICGKEYPFGTDLVFDCEEISSLKVGCEIGNDINQVFPNNEKLVSNGATIIANIGASSEIIGSEEKREAIFKVASSKLICGYIGCNASEYESTTDSVYSAHNLICENGKILSVSKPFEQITGDVISEIDVQKIESIRTKNNTIPGSFEYRHVKFSLNVEETTLTRTIEKNPFVPDDEKELKKRCNKILKIQSHALARRLIAANSKKAVIGISGGLDSTLSLIASIEAFDYLNYDRKDIYAITMPGFGTTKRTKSNATKLCEYLGVTLKEVNISKSVKQHFADIGHDINSFNVTFENAQARERTQVLMDISNEIGGLQIGTGDLSEIALGWSTYNGDHMSMYNVNCSVPKTLIRFILREYAEQHTTVRKVLEDILDTPVSPELLPPKDGDIAQKTEEIVGPYELHEFFLYHFIKNQFSPSKILRLAAIAFKGIYDEDSINKWLRLFIKRFFTQQFKRSCSSDGVKVGSVDLSPRGDLKMPSDSLYDAWIEELESSKE